MDKNVMKIAFFNKKWFGFRLKAMLLFTCFFFFQYSLNAQQLQSYIEEAENNNPQIRAFELRYDTSLEKVNAASLPNTEISAGYFASAPETRTGAQVARFSVRQLLPWFGTIASQKEYASAMAETDYIEIAIAKRKIGLNVAKSYYNLYTITAKQKIINQQINLLNRYEQLALTSVEVGKASAVDVLKLQIRQNVLQKQQDILEQDYLAEKVGFNTLLNRDKAQKISLMDTLFIPQEEFMVEQADLSVNPELLKYDQMNDAVAQQEMLNQKQRAPMIGVGLDYIPVAERPEMTFNDNGKDIVMPMLSVSIPIFNRAYTSNSKQNNLRQSELLAQKNDQINSLERRFAEAKSGLKAAKISYFTQENNLKQAKNAEEILLKNYETGTIDFNDVLDIQELQLEFQLDRIEAVQHYFTQAAVINYLTQS